MRGSSTYDDPIVDFRQGSKSGLKGPRSPNGLPFRAKPNLKPPGSSEDVPVLTPIDYDASDKVSKYPGTPPVSGQGPPDQWHHAPPRPGHRGCWQTTGNRDRDVPGAKLKVSPIRQYFPDSASFTKIYPHHKIIL